MVPRSAPSVPWLSAAGRVRSKAPRIAPHHLPHLTFHRSGTAALRAVLTAVDPQVVYVSAYTCEDVPNLVAELGLRVRFMPLLPRSYLCEPKVEAKPRRAVAIVTHLYGGRAALPAPRPGLFVVEDACQAFSLVPPSPEADAVVWSFGSGKPVNLNGGGVLACKRPLATDDPYEENEASRRRYLAVSALHDPKVYNGQWRSYEDGWSAYKFGLLRLALREMPQWYMRRLLHARLLARATRQPIEYLNMLPVQHDGRGLEAYDVSTGYTLYEGSRATHRWVRGHVALPLDPCLATSDVRRMAAVVRR